MEISETKPYVTIEARDMTAMFGICGISFSLVNLLNSNILSKVV